MLYHALKMRLDTMVAFNSDAIFMLCMCEMFSCILMLSYSGKYFQCKWVDVVFYYTRALAAHHAFETSRQPLFTAFNDMRKKVVFYFVLFFLFFSDERCLLLEAFSPLLVYTFIAISC